MKSMLDVIGVAMTDETGLCHATYIGDTGIEWVCIAKVHNPAYVRKTGDRTHRKGEVVRGTGGHQPGPERGFSAPQADRHYYVERWPNRQWHSREV